MPASIFTLVITLLGFGAAASAQAADVSDYEIQKLEQYDQNSSAAPTIDPKTPFQFTSNVNSNNGATLLSTSTIAAPVGSPNFFEAGTGGLYFQERFISKAQLDTVFPVGTYNLAVNSSTPNSYTAQAVFGPDNYPPIPQIVGLTNATWSGNRILVTDITQPVTVTWNSFNSGATQGSINIFVDNTSIGQQFVADGTTNSFTFAPSTATALSNNQTFEVTLSFQNIVGNTNTNIPGASSGVSYQTEDEFIIQTGTGSSSSSDHLSHLGKGNILLQTSNSAPVNAPLYTEQSGEISGPYGFIAQNGVAGSVTGPGAGSPYALGYRTDNDGGNYQYSSGSLAALTGAGSLNTLYPDGTYTVKDINGNVVASLALTGDVYPNVPKIIGVNGNTPTWNAQGQLVLDPTIDNTITWSPFTTTNANYNVTTGGNTSAEFESENSTSNLDINIETGLTHANTAPFNSLLVPANSMTPGATYSGNVQYYLSSSVIYAAGVPTSAAGYETQVNFTALATAPAATLGYAVRKTNVLQQNSNLAPANSPLGTTPGQPGPYSFRAQSPVTGTETGPAPGGTNTLLFSSNNDDYRFTSAAIGTQNALDSAYPDGTYTLTDGNNVALTGDIYPNAPKLTAVNGVAPIWNSSGQLVIDPTIQNTLTWSAFTTTNSSFTFTTGGGEHFNLAGIEDTIGLSVKAGIGTASAAAFNTQIIPPNTLTAGNTYSVTIDYALASALTSPSANTYDSASYTTQNYFIIAPVVSTSSFNSVIKSATYAQSSTSAPTTNANSYTLFASSIAAGSVTGPAGSSVPGPYTLTPAGNAGAFYSGSSFSTQTALNAAYLDGTYILADGTSVNLTGDSYPTAPQVTQVNGAAPVWIGGQLVLNPQIANTITWTSFSGNFATGEEDFSFIGNQDSANVSQVAFGPGSGSLGTSSFTSITIPAGTMTSGNTYLGGIDYYQDPTVTQLSSGNYDLAKYETITNFTVLAAAQYSVEKAHILQQTTAGAPVDYTGPADEPGPYNFHSFGTAGSTTGPPPTNTVYPLVFSSSDHTYEYFSTGFASLASLNATYPDGTYTLSNGGTVPLTGDVFPNNIQVTAVNGAPPIFNASGQLALDPAVDNVITWTPFTGSNGSFTYSTAGSEHVEIFGNGDGVNIDQQASGPYGAAAFNTLTIPANTLTSGNTYTGSFEYSLSSGGSVNPPTGAVYLTNTYLTILGTGTEPQSIGFISTFNGTSIPTQTVGNAPIGLTSSASSGLTITFTIASGPATISGNFLTVTGPGSVTVVASSAGDATFAPTSFSQTFNVTPTPPTQLVSTITILHSFDDGSVANDGIAPESNLIQASNGFYYGTTVQGGSASVGTIYEITAGGKCTIIHSFGDGTVANDGSSPFAGLVESSDGNFYGTTPSGGSAASGTVFKITPQGLETILHSFGDGSVLNDGIQPGGLVQGSDGNFYGTTGAGGSASKGTVYKITPQGTVTILHSVGDGSVANEGSSAGPTLIQAADGNFYGTLFSGGSAGLGAIFDISPQGVETILHSFGDGSVANDGQNPAASLLQGPDGNFYGITEAGGSSGLGTVFRISSLGQVTVLHNFGDGSVVNDGQNPQSTLIKGSDGNFYAMAPGGGSTSQGVIYEITPQGSVTILHSFKDGTVINDGGFPNAALVQGPDGNFYGITIQGGANRLGTVFKLTLGAPQFTSSTTASGTVGLPFNYPVTTSSPCTSFSANNLPGGLSINAATGLITGTPTFAGTRTATITFTGTAGTNTAQVTFTIVPLPVPSVSSILYAFGSLGNAFTYTTTATNNTTSFSATGLTGTGLTISPTTGVISGTPSTVGSFPVSLTATNTTGTSAALTLTIQIFALPPTLSQEYVILHRFNDGSVTSTGPNLNSNGTLADGQNPFQIFQAFDGTYYGTAFHGGSYNDGATFNLTDQGITSIIASFSDGGGSNPPPVVPQGFIQGSDGNFYGATEFGGDTTSNGDFIKVNPSGLHMNLHQFNDGTVLGDGSNPQGTPVQGADGNFYGVTLNGGTGGDGTVYKITPLGVETVLHSFGGRGVVNDGLHPTTALIQGTDGNFYGTTPFGGSAGEGIIYKITTAGVLTILHNFGDGTVANDGTYPAASLLQGTDGNFYGTTQYGGVNGTGAVFRLTTSGLTILHSFADGTVAHDGANPTAALIQGLDGNFYGTTVNGGASGLGTVFQITTSGVTTLVHNFGDGTAANDGANPVGALYQDTNGNFYGTTLNGGAGSGYGTAFVIVATQTSTHLPVFTGAAFATGSVDAPLTFTPKAQFGVSGGGLAGNSIVAELESIAASFVKEFSQAANWSVSPTNALPNYLTFDSSSGTISGTPLQAGTYTFTMTPHNALGNGTAQTVTLYIDVPPVITSPAIIQQPATQAVSYQIAGNAAPTLFGAIGLPGWLSVNTATGLVTGTPPGPGIYAFTATATNFAGTGSLLVTLNLSGTNSLVPAILSASTAGGAAGRPFMYQISATNSPMSFSALVLPPGLLFDPTMGMITGTPTTAGTFALSITATNDSGTTAAELTATIAPAAVPVISGPLTASATPPNAFSYQIPATGLIGIYNAVGLPYGLTVDPASGIISGTPTQPGQFPVYVTATNGTGTGSATLNLTVAGTFVPPTTWLMGYPSLVGGLTGTPENDGIPNLLKFLFDIIPTRPMTGADRAALPAVGFDKTSNPGTEYLAITYRQYALATGVTVNLLTSSDMQNWQPVTPDIDQPMSTDPATGDPIMEIGIKTTGATQFIRLQVTAQ